MSDITQLLQAMDRGETSAAEELLPLVYQELRRVAARKMAGEPSGHTLQATALVHEAWLRLATGHHQEWRGRKYFFAVAAEAMRRILIERARRRMSSRNAGFAHREELSESMIVVDASTEELLAVHEALSLLEQEDEQAAELVKLRYFVGMTMTESAEAMGHSLRSTERLWTFSKAFLKSVLSDQPMGDL